MNTNENDKNKNENDKNKLEIEYPCNWGYKVIGSDVDEILSAIEQSALGLEYTVSPSNISKTGKYYSFNIEMEVPNEVVRDLIFENLQKSEHIKFVL
jgi:uncharacterized protein